MQHEVEKYLLYLESTPIFHGIDQNEMKSMFQCLGAYIRNIKKDEYIILCGDDVNYLERLLHVDWIRMQQFRFQLPLMQRFSS